MTPYRYGEHLSFLFYYPSHLVVGFSVTVGDKVGKSKATIRHGDGYSTSKVFFPPIALPE